MEHCYVEKLPTLRWENIFLLDFCSNWPRGNITHGAYSSVRAVRCGATSPFPVVRFCLLPKHQHGGVPSCRSFCTDRIHGDTSGAN